MDILERDDGLKGVSVEIDVLESKNENGFEQAIDFIFDGITILGDLISPAVKNAQMEVVQFASKERKEYEEAYRLEFGKYDELDLSIPEVIKNNAIKGLSLDKEHGNKSNSVVLAHARRLQKDTHSTPDRIRSMAKLLANYAKKDLVEDPPSKEYISYLSLGGHDGLKWATELLKGIDDIDAKKLSYFGKDSERKEDKPNVEDEKKDKVEEPENKEEMATENKEEEKKEDPKEEAKETAEEEKKEEMSQEEPKEEDYSLSSYLDLAALLNFLEGETENYRDVAEKEFARPDGEKNFAKVMGAMFAKAQKLQEMCNRMSTEKEDMCNKMAEKEDMCNRMAQENEQLRQFKSQVEQDKFNFEVASTMSEVKEDMPKEEFEALQEKAKEFSLENIDAFKNLARAKAFEFSKGKRKNDDGIIRIGLPFVNDQKGKKSIWD